MLHNFQVLQCLSPSTDLRLWAQDLSSEEAISGDITQSVCFSWIWTLSEHVWASWFSPVSWILSLLCVIFNFHSSSLAERWEYLCHLATSHTFRMCVFLHTIHSHASLVAWKIKKMYNVCTEKAIDTELSTNMNHQEEKSRNYFTTTYLGNMGRY